MTGCTRATLLYCLVPEMALPQRNHRLSPNAYNLLTLKPIGTVYQLNAYSGFPSDANHIAFGMEIEQMRSAREYPRARGAS